MASLADIRESNPAYRGLDDAALADLLHREFYSDIPRAAFDERIGMVTRRPIQPGDVLPQVPMEGGPPIQYTADGLPFYQAPPQRGAVTRATEGATQAFGERPVGDVPGVGRLPGVAGAAVTGVDILLRSVAATIAGGAGGIAGLAEQAGLDQTSANKLERDLRLLADSAAVVAGAGPTSVTTRTAATRPTTATRGAAATPLDDLAQRAAAADAAMAEPAATTIAGDAIELAARRTVEAERTAQAGPNRAGNINLDRIYAPDDVKLAIQNTAAENADFIAARRGVVTHEETRDMARLLGMNADDLATRRTGQAFNAEEMFAARELLVAQATKVRNLARSAQGGSDAARVDFAKEVTRLVAIQEQVAGATAEAGRALSQFRMLAGATKDEIARMVEASKASGIDDMAARIAQLDDPAAVASFARNAYGATKSDMVFEAWVNALLSGPQTHAANIASNALVNVWGVAESATAAAISKFTGSGIQGREALGRVWGIIEGAKDGLRAGWQAFRTEEPTGLVSKIEASHPRAIPSANIGGLEVGGKQVRIPGRLLMAEDEFFKAISYRGEVNALAIRQAADEGAKGAAFFDRVNELRANPTEAMRDAARAAAEKQTFTNPLGAAGKAVQTMVREVPGLRFIVPFIRTPINLVTYAAERTPFAPLFKQVREDIAAGGAKRDNALARIALGSTVSGLTAYMAKEGHITGGGPGPTETARLAAMRSDGWQPYSLRVGDTYYSYSRFEPFGMLMGVAADFVDMNDNMTRDEKNNLAVLLAGSAARNLVSKTWLRGPAETIQAIQDPQRYGPRYIQRLVGTIVPTAASQIAQANDPYMREARTILDAVRARIPGEREKLFVRRDAFGEPIQREGSLGPDLVSPIYQSAAKNDPTIAEVLRLNVAPGRLPRTMRGAELTDAEFDRYSTLAGQMTKRGLDTLVALPQWRDLPEAAQVEAFHDVIRKSRDIARSQVIAEFPDLPLRIVAETAKRKRLPKREDQ